MRVERRNHEAGAGNCNNEVNFVGTKGSTAETFFGGFAAKLDGVLDIFIVCLRKSTWLNRIFDGEDGMALMNLGVIDDSHHGFDAALGNIEDAAHVIFHVVASDKVRG